MKDKKTKILSLQPGMVALVGIPLDENSSFLRGPALAPAKIREALYCGSMNLVSEEGTDLGNDAPFKDLGDLGLPAGPAAFKEIEKTISALLDRSAKIVSLGGDHSITYPIVKAFGKRNPKLTLVHLDAHPDLYDEYDGNRFSNACPFARIMEDKCVDRLVQVGIRTMNPPQLEQAKRFGVEVIQASDWEAALDLQLSGPIYLSLDLDVLDPAFAPGVSHHEPGGLSTRDVIALIHRLPEPILGADIVECNPKRDPVGITAMAAAKLLKEIASRMLRGPGSRG